MRGDQLGVVHHEHTTATCKHVLNRPSPDAASLFFQHMHLLKRHITHTKWVIPGTKNSSTLARRTQSWPHREYDRPWTARVRGGQVGQITIAVRFLAPAAKRDQMCAVQSTKSVTYPRFCPKSTRRRYGPASTRFQASAKMELAQHKHRSKHAQPTCKQVQHAHGRHRNTTCRSWRLLSRRNGDTRTLTPVSRTGARMRHVHVRKKE